MAYSVNKKESVFVELGSLLDGSTLDRKKHWKLYNNAKKIASLIKKPLPVICEIDVSNVACFYIIQQLNRLVQRRLPPEGNYYIFAWKGKNSPTKGLFLGKAGDFELWEINGEAGIEP